MNSRDDLKRINLYLREEFPGQLDSIIASEREIQTGGCLSLDELKFLGVPQEQIKILLANQKDFQIIFGAKTQPDGCLSMEQLQDLGVPPDQIKTLLVNQI